VKVKEVWFSETFILPQHYMVSQLRRPGLEGKDSF
jgi:hypothetical protein